MAALFMFVLGWLVGVLFPSVGDVSTIRLGALATIDLHFATPDHVTPFIFSDFETANPPEASLGILYLIAPFLLYQVSKLVVDFGISGRDIPLVDGALTGMTVILGYLPIMLVVALLAPSSQIGVDFSLINGIVFAGLVYPLVFGAIGGLSAAYYSPNQRRVGLLYGIVAFVTGLVLVFLSSFLFLDTSDVELSVVNRLITSIGAFVQVHTLSFVNVADMANVTIPLVVVMLVIAGMGFLRAWRSPDIQSPGDAFTRSLTPVITYFMLVSFLASVTLLVADPWVQKELDLGSIGFSSFPTMFPEMLAMGPLRSIGTYVTATSTTFLVLPIMLCGTFGIIALLVENYEQSKD